jgi:AcrR family transcriptional regulator
MTRGPRGAESRPRRTAARPAAARADDGRDLRGLILEATERLLQERPVHELTVLALCEAAGVSRASFYIYFESKYAPVAALAEQVTDTIYRDHWEPFLGGAESPTLENYTDHWRQTTALWERHRAVLVAAAAAWRAEPAATDGWRALWTTYIGLNRGFIERAQARGDAPAELDAATLAASLTWMAENALYLAFTETAPEFLDHERLTQAHCGIWYRAIFGSAAPPAASQESNQA